MIGPDAAAATGIAVLATVLISFAPPTLAQQPAASGMASKPTPGFQTADIGDKELRYKCEGQGAPAVIIEQGGGISLEKVFSWETRSPEAKHDGPLPKEWTDAIEPLWQELQRELAQLSTKSKHIVATKAGHNIQLEEPDLVLDSILDVVKQVRKP